MVDQVYAGADPAAKLREALPPRLQVLAAPAAGALREPAVRAVEEAARRAAAAGALGQGGVAVSRPVHRAGQQREPSHPRQRRRGRPGRAPAHRAGGRPPRAADRRLWLPEGSGVIKIMDAQQLDAMRTVVKLLKTLAIVLFLLAIVLLGIAIWLARGRRREITAAAALSLIVAAIVALLLRRVLGNQVIGDLANTATGQAAADSVFAIGTSLLAKIARTLLLLGLLLLLGAWLSGPSRLALRIRTFLRPALLARPEMVHGAVLAVLLALLAIGIIPGIRTALAALLWSSSSRSSTWRSCAGSRRSTGCTDGRRDTGCGSANRCRLRTVVRMPTYRPARALEPSPERIENATPTRYQEVAGGCGCSFDSVCGAVAAGRSTTSRGSGPRSGSFFEVQAPSARTSACSAGARCRAPSGSRARALNYAEHIFRGRDDDGRRDPPRVRAARAGRGDLGRAARARPRAIAAGLRALRRGAGRPRRRLPAEHPRDDRGLPGVARRSARSGRRCSPDFGARTRRRPLRADRAEGAARRRRLPLRRARTSTAATSSTSSQAEMPSLRAHGRLLATSTRDAPTGRLGRAPAAGGRASSTFDAAAVRPPAVGALLARARPGCRRRSCTGHGGILLEQLKKMHLHLDAQAGDRVFWFTTTGWMMWNFLVGVPADRGVDRALRRQPGLPGPRRRCGTSRPTPASRRFGTSAALHRRVHEGGRRAGARGATCRRCARSARPGSPLSPEGFDWVYEQVGADTWLFSTSRRHGRLHAPSSAACRRCPSTRASCRRRSLGAAVESWDEEGRPLIGEVGELVITEPLPSMPIVLLERPRRRALPRGVLRHVPRRLAPRRLDRDHRRAARRSSTAARTRRSTAAACGWAPARSTARCSRSTRSSTRSSSTSRATARKLDAAVRRAARRRRARRRPRAGDRARASARTARRATCPTRSTQIAEVPRTLSGKVLEVPVKRILMGTAPEKAASRDSLANPAALDWFVDLAAQR